MAGDARAGSSWADSQEVAGRTEALREWFAGSILDERSIAALAVGGMPLHQIEAMFPQGDPQFWPPVDGG